ncbi:MAG: hypothetical protein WAS21_26135 [Geminicoccaceae bacterium]
MRLSLIRCGRDGQGPSKALRWEGQQRLDVMVGIVANASESAMPGVNFETRPKDGTSTSLACFQA